MSEEKQETPKPEQPRDEKGHFSPKDKTESTDTSQPKTSDYTKMNSFMAMQLGLSDKIAEWQTQYTPPELFSKLEFMMSNIPSKTTDKLPPNKPIAPVSSQAKITKINIDNFTERMESDSRKGGFHGDISLIGIKNRKK